MKPNVARGVLKHRPPSRENSMTGLCSCTVTFSGNVSASPRVRAARVHQYIPRRVDGGVIIRRADRPGRFARSRMRCGSSSVFSISMKGAEHLGLAARRHRGVILSRPAPVAIDPLPFDDLFEIPQRRPRQA